ncbi:family 1 glycosylhydrolase [Ruegeria sp. MALMAid1280]|uniref:family 1 glycosylhydrolase n=1 Tax=Ruegeria sp. MALMAid1280 TaxID=3411634 RepID=UPI003B9F75FC
MQDIRADFPKDFLFGFATSGGHHASEPLNLGPVQMAGFDCYRFLTRWAHVLPEGRGPVNHTGLDHYDRLADALLEHGMRPCVTLCGHDLPLTLDDLGGWRNRDVAGWFADFAETLMSRIGDRMFSVAPIDGPAWLGDPNLRDVRTTTRRMHHMLLGHGRSIEAMRGLGMTKLGVEIPLGKAENDSCSADLLGSLFNNAYAENALGRLEPYLPIGWQDDFDIIRTSVDWCGMHCDARGPTDAAVLTRIAQGFTKDLPLYLIENGNSERQKDPARFSQTLQTAHKALDQGVQLKALFIHASGIEDLPAMETKLRGSTVSLPLAQPAGAMREHWNLVADIGGTNTRLGVISNGKLTDLRKYPTGTLPELLAAFHGLRDEIGTDPRAVVAAGAGPVKDGTIRLTNANLDLSEGDIGRATGAQHTFVINDFTAAAWSVAEVTGNDVEVLQGIATPPPGTRLVVGPGTGLGVGALLFSDGRYHTASGEGGHVGLSPRHLDEVEIFRAARHIAPDCFFDDTLVLEAEMFLSGTGLPILYQAAGMAAGQANTPQRSARDILEDARTQTDPVAVKTAHMFTTHLGAVMGDLAVVLIPSGGVFLVGGVAEKNRWLFKDAFRDAFNAGGRFSDLRRSFNLYVSEQEEFGIVGANNFCKSVLARQNARPTP